MISPHYALVEQALSAWGRERLYLRSDTTNNGVELLLYCLGGRGVSGTNRTDYMARGGTVEHVKKQPLQTKGCIIIDDDA